MNMDAVLRVLVRHGFVEPEGRRSVRCRLDVDAVVDVYADHVTVTSFEPGGRHTMCDNTTDLDDVLSRLTASAVAAQESADICQLRDALGAPAAAPRRTGCHE